jgi:hypothetical protein
MTSPLPTLFGWHPTKQLDLDQPDGCDHDQNVYHYRLVDGAMVLRGIALGSGWESRPMDWRGLSCYKQRGDMQMALITKESGRPEARKDKDEIMAKAIPLINGGMKVAIAARELGVPVGTLHNWVNKARKKQAELAKHEALLESVDAGHVKSMGCIEVAPIGVEVPQYDPSDNDFADDEPIPYVVKPEPIDAQIDIILDILWAEKRAKLKAHLKPLLSDAEAWDMVKHIVSRGLA